MASKNVIEEYFIKITADAKDVQKQMNSALNNIAKKSKLVNQKMADLDVKIKNTSVKKKILADKEYDIVQDTLRKNNLKKEEAASKRDLDLAKVAYKQKTSYIKQHVDKLTKSNNKQLSEMAKFYKEQERLAKQHEAKKQRLLDKTNAIKRTDYWQTLEQMSPREAAMYSKKMNEAISKGNVEALKDVAAEVRRSSRSIQRSMREMTFVQQGLHDSTKNMIRSYISLFALFEGTRAIKNVGMQFEGMRAGMLIAAKDSDDVMTKLRFVDKEATRLGLNLVETSKSFVKISAAAKGRMAESDIQEIFLGIAEAGTVMQLSMDDVNGTLRAVQQMIQKGQIYAKLIGA